MSFGGLPESLAESIQNSKAEYRQLGKCGLRVSVPIFGTMSIGHRDWMPWLVEEEEALPLLKAAYDRGLNTWDTANVYSNGISEQLIAKAMKKYDIPRHKVVIMSKCWGYVGESPEIWDAKYPEEIKLSKDYINQAGKLHEKRETVLARTLTSLHRTGLSRTAIFNAVNGILARLETDYLDLLQIHRFDPTVPIEETMEALHDLVKAGKVRYIGASSMWTYQFAMMQHVADKNGWTKFVSMQNRYSLLYREEEREMNKYCSETGVGLIPWQPLHGGFLARSLSASGSTERANWGGDELSEADKAVITRVEEVAKKQKWTMSQVSLAWVLQRGAIPIVGFSKVSRIDEALGVRGKTLTDEDMKYLEEPYRPKEIASHN
jgi:aryl-alcohol dehydrogenase-like predicted oxidoreductase